MRFRTPLIINQTYSPPPRYIQPIYELEVAILSLKDNYGDVIASSLEECCTSHCEAERRSRQWDKSVIGASDDVVSHPFQCPFGT